MLLAPTVGAEFSGLLLPSDWSAAPWATGGGATVNGGMLTVDGALAGTDFIDSALGDADLLGKPVTGYAHRFQEVFKKDFTGMHRREVTLDHG